MTLQIILSIISWREVMTQKSDPQQWTSITIATQHEKLIPNSKESLPCVKGQSYMQKAT